MRLNIQVYVEPEQKLKIEKASKQIGLNQSSFCRSASIEKANQVLQKEENDTGKKI